MLQTRNVAGIQPEQETKEDPGKRDASGARYGAEQQRFCEQLTDDANAAGAQRCANTPARAIGRRAREQQVGGIAAGDHENAADRAEQQPQK